MANKPVKRKSFYAQGKRASANQAAFLTKFISEHREGFDPDIDFATYDAMRNIWSKRGKLILNNVCNAKNFYTIYVLMVWNINGKNRRMTLSCSPDFPITADEGMELSEHICIKDRFYQGIPAHRIQLKLFPETEQQHMAHIRGYLDEGLNREFAIGFH